MMWCVSKKMKTIGKVLISRAIFTHWDYLLACTTYVEKT